MTLPTLQSSSLTSDYRWNPVAGRYVDERGKFVPFSDVRDALESVMDAARGNMHAITQQLVDQQISVAEWQLGMMDNIKIAHVAAGSAANGGWAQMSQSDWGATGRLVRDQYDYLRSFANQVADGTQALNGQALVRADMYGEAARGTFEEMRRRYEKISNGMTEARRVLGAADHCDDCLDYAAEGWMPIDDVPAIGDSVCLTKCHCTIEYRSESGGEVEE